MTRDDAGWRAPMLATLGTTLRSRNQQLRTAADIERAGIPVYLYLFDVLVLDEEDLTGLPLHERRRRLANKADPWADIDRHAVSAADVRDRVSR